MTIVLMCSTPPEQTENPRHIPTTPREKEVQQDGLFLHLMFWISIISNFAHNVRLH
jgi:hypothetical protein